MPCTVALTANVSDPNGDSLSYDWSGCASGSGKNGSCTVGAIGAFTATVTVRDGRGGEATASHEVEGLNDSPVLDLDNEPNQAVACGTAVTLNYEVADDQSTGTCNVVQVTGRCTFKKKTCGGGVFSVTVTTTSDHTGGSCIIKGANWTDPWGLTTADNPRFDVQACP